MSGRLSPTQFGSQSGRPTLQERIRLAGVGTEAFHERDADRVDHVLVTITKRPIHERKQPIGDVGLPVGECADCESQEVAHEQVEQQFVVVAEVLNHDVMGLRYDDLELIHEVRACDHAAHHGSTLVATHAHRLEADPRGAEAAG